MYWQIVALIFFFQAEDGIRDYKVTGVQTCALPISADLPELIATLTPRLFFVTSSRDGCERTLLARAFERKEDRTTAPSPPGGARLPWGWRMRSFILFHDRTSAWCAAPPGFRNVVRD